MVCAGVMSSPREYGPHKTLYNRWSVMGIFIRMMQKSLYSAVLHCRTPDFSSENRSHRWQAPSAVSRCSTTCSLTTSRKGSAPHCSHPQKRLLPPWNGISCGFRTHPSRLAWFIANQNVKEGARRSRNMLLRKQRCDLLPVYREDEHPSIKISNIKLSFRVR